MSKSDSVPHSETLRVRDNCLCLHSQRAARAVARYFDEAFRPLGITSGQFSMLMSLNRPEPPTVSQAAAPLGMDRTTLTANLKPLERKGLVEIIVDPQDRRGRRLLLTDAGNKILAAALPIWERGEAELETLVDDPDALRGGLRALGDKPG